MSEGRVSAVVLTKDSQGSIRDCLESVKFADEIVIIDDCSTDSTLGICRNYTEKIIRNKLKSFSEQRNLGIDASNGDWILQLDADEVVTPALADAIRKAASSAGPCLAFRCRRKNFFLGHFMRYGGWYHYSVNLFRKGSGRYEGLVHERLKLSGAIGTIEADLEHGPFKSIGEFVARQNRYTDYEAADMLNEKGVVNKRTVFGNLYFKPLKLFWKLYVRKQGFREGMYGFIFCVLYSFVHFLKWAKYWELTYAKGQA